MTTEPLDSLEPTREDLVEALHHICHEAKREQTIIGTEAYPPSWDRLHETLDGLLADLVGR